MAPVIVDTHVHVACLDTDRYPRSPRGVDGGDEPAWLTDGRGAAVWDAAGALGITVVPVVFPRHLGAVRALAEPRPSVVVALDHAGFPDHPLDAGAPVLGLADLPAVHLKVSSHLLLEAPDPAAELGQLVAAFGAERLCWGSDYPQTSPDYGSLLACGQAAAAGLSAADREAFLAGTAARLF